MIAALLARHRAARTRAQDMKQEFRAVFSPVSAEGQGSGADLSGNRWGLPFCLPAGQNAHIRERIRLASHSTYAREPAGRQSGRLLSLWSRNMHRIRGFRSVSTLPVDLAEPAGPAGIKYGSDNGSVAGFSGELRDRAHAAGAFVSLHRDSVGEAARKIQVLAVGAGAGA